jgi:hypothetical protein
VSREDAERRLGTFERGHGRELVELASHAALPVVLNPDFVHLLRVNYFLDPPATLPYAAEAELLLSQLCTEIDDGLYAIDPDLRDVLLQRLVRQHGGTGRLRDVARLLWEYGQRFAPWPDRPGLPEAQQLSALNFIDPRQAQAWLARAEETAGAGAVADERWFVAVRQDLAGRGAAVLRAEEDVAAEAGPPPAEVLVENGRMTTPPPEWHVLEEHRDQVEAAASSMCLIIEPDGPGSPLLPPLNRSDLGLSAFSGFLAGRRVLLTSAAAADRFAFRLYKPGPATTGTGIQIWLGFARPSPAGTTVGTEQFVRASVTQVEWLANSQLAALVIEVEAQSALPAPLATSSVPPPDPVGRDVYLVGYARETALWTGQTSAFVARVVRPGKIVSLNPGRSGEEAEIIHNCPAPFSSAGSPLVDVITGQVLGINLTDTDASDARRRTLAEAVWPTIHKRVLALDAEALNPPVTPSRIATSRSDGEAERDFPLFPADVNLLLDELSLNFSSEERAQALLRAVRFPGRLVPAWRDDAFDFWARIFEDLNRGAMQTPYRRLIAMALRVYGGNQTLANLWDRYRAPGDAPAPEPTAAASEPASATCHLVVRVSTDQERDDIQAWLTDQGFDPQQEWRTGTAVSFRLNEADPNVVTQRMRLRPDLGWTVVPPGQPDYLLRQLFVEGPDGRSFRFSDVPASSPVGSVGEELIDQYPEGLPGSDQPLVIDKVAADGTGERVNPDSTLHQEGITDGIRLRVGFQRQSTEEAEGAPSRADINRLLDEMSYLFGTEGKATAFLRSVEFPVMLIPAWQDDAHQFWALVFEELDRGALVAPYQQLVSAALRVFPGNAALHALDRGYLEPSAPEASIEQPPTTPQPGSSAATSGEPDEPPQYQFLTGPDGRKFRFTDMRNLKILNLPPGDQTREINEPDQRLGRGARLVLDVRPPNDAAAEAGPGVVVGGGDTTCHVVVYCLTEEQADIARWLRDQGFDPEEIWSTASAASFRVNQADQDIVTTAMRARPDLRWTVVSPGQPDYLLSQLSVEGPDGQSFRLTNVPSSVTTDTMAQTVIEQYPAEVSGGASPLVVDVVGQDDATRRTSADSTLDDEGITEGSRLRVGFQRRAA